MNAKKLIAGLLGATAVLSAAPAFAGEWRFDPRRCPDLVEDRYDRLENRRDYRRTYSRRDIREDRADRREDRRDAAFTVCPRSAFVYIPDRWEQSRYDRSYDRRGRSYAYGRSRTPELRLSYDRRVGLPYRYENGRKIYVRG